MSDNNLEEKKSTEEKVENTVEESQVEANASSTEEVAETEANEQDDATEVVDSTEDDASENTSDDDAEDSDSTSDDDEEDEIEPYQRPLQKVSVEDFNWEAYEQDVDDYNSGDRKRLEDMYAETLSHVDERQVVDGTVVSVNDRDVVVNIGFKSDGMVPASEFKYMGDDLKEGAVVKIMVEKREDAQGQIKLSHKKALEESAWDTIVEAHENDRILKGYIADRTKGGMVVQLLGLDAFLPGSQIDVKPIKDYDVYVGTSMDLKVVKLNLQYRNIVVSHKAIIESDLEQQKTEILGSLEKGQVLEGVVKNLTSFGVFVDLGGVDGLIHITDVSWGRINHPEEVLELGQKINCVVLDYDEDKKRISLGLKQLTQHPWETLPEEIVEGSVVKGKVVNIEDYGAFLEIYPGVEGLIHVSEMSWSTHLKSPQEYLHMGDEVEAKVLTIDREERKLALGMKQLTQDPWENIEQKYPTGSKHEAVVRSMTNFGLFMELEEGIDGLVHISDLSWTRKFNHPAEFTKVGEKHDVVVLEIDKENRRLSLGYKQLEDDPWDTFESIFLNNSVHKGSVERIEDKGAIIILPYGVEAFAPTKHMMKQEKGAKFTEGESGDFKVLEFDRENRRIVVSHTQVWKDEERAAKDAENAEKNKEAEKTTKAVKSLQKSVSSDTLADANDILAGLKRNLEAEELEKQKEAMKKMDAQTKPSDEDAEEGENSSEENSEDDKEDSAE
ncbi:30S ribosomal protein S1 [bacterium]|nr:30S ribosomal protein S1 [bacterium]